MSKRPPALVGRELAVIELEGLMTVGPLTDDEGEIRRSFALLRELRDQSRGSDGPQARRI